MRKTRPYNSMKVYFQGVIFVNNAVFQSGQAETSAFRVYSIELSLRNLLLAYYVQYVSGGPGWTGTSAAKVNISPLDWWRWAYIRMHPSPDQRVFANATRPTDTQLFNYFSQWQLFRHIKTDFRVLNTDVTNTPDVRILASLLTQDSYWQVQNKTSADLSQLKFPSFAELTAWGAQWAFLPGQKSVSGRSFNHHSMRGTNDPKGEPWKTLTPLQHQVVSDINWVFGTLFLAEFSNFTVLNEYNTENRALAATGLSETWSIVKVRSLFEFGNQQYLLADSVRFTSHLPS